MPITIPYDPSLVLGNIVEEEILNNLLSIAKLQAPIDAAQDELNSLISLKRSIDMTIQEMLNMNVDTTELIAESEKVNKQVSQVALNYAKVMLDHKKQIQQLKAKVPVVHSGVESPIDYNRTQIKKMPLAVDSLRMDVQYFSFDENQQNAENTITAIKSYISAQTRFLGGGFSFQTGKMATEQINRQLQSHKLAGTLVITATCMHKDAALLAPFILDVDKAIRVWNRTFKNDNDKIKIDDVTSMQKIAAEEGTDKEKSITLISGVTYGSSFVGMVHILKTESTKTSQTMRSLAAGLQMQARKGNWYSHINGGFGLDASFANDIKNLLSKQDINSHVTMITMGVIPSIKSNDVKIAVKEFVDFDPAKMMDKMAALANLTNKERENMAESAKAARTGAEMMAIRNSEIKGVLLGLSEIDDGRNKILDINSMMTAFEDFINKVNAGSSGVPINYYIKSITRAQLAEMWVAKYYPNEYLAISGDDSGKSNDSIAQKEAAPTKSE